MKKIGIFILITCFLFAFSACGSESVDTDSEPQDALAASGQIEKTLSAVADTDTTQAGEDAMSGDAVKTNILVTYFSCTGTTRQIAESAAEILGADLYEIVPEEPYTQEDLAYYTGGRADQEQDNPDMRPVISGSAANIEQYDTVLIGYPIWHGQAPRIISTFLESYDFTGKTILPFCTSHSSGIGSSADNLHVICPDAVWLAGERFSGSASKSDVEAWLNGLGMVTEADRRTGIREFNFETHTVILNSGYEMPINGLGTYSLHGEECINSVKAALKRGVRLIDTASSSS